MSINSKRGVPEDHTAVAGRLIQPGKNADHEEYNQEHYS